MKILITIIMGISLVSCGNQLIKKGPAREKAQRFYKLDFSRPGAIYHQSCKFKRKKRVCTKEYMDLNREWKFFAPGFILIPAEYVFP